MLTLIPVEREKLYRFMVNTCLFNAWRVRVFTSSVHDESISPCSFARGLEFKLINCRKNKQSEIPIYRKMHDHQSAMKTGLFRAGSAFLTENFSGGRKQLI